MNTTLVSARMPQAKKDATVRVLDSLGSTVSDLINSAFDYVLDERCLPQSASHGRPEQSTFAAFVEDTTFEVAWPSNFKGDYKTMLREGKQHDYESLA